MKENTKKFILATSVLAGTIIGVGFFSLPQLTNKVGLGIMLSYFVILGGLTLLIHILFGEVALATPDFLRLPGYAKIHLGAKGKNVALITMILGTYGSILAYLIIGGKFLAGLGLPLIGNNELLATLLYFAVGAVLIYLGINPIAKIDFWSLIIMILIFGTIFVSGSHGFKIENFFAKTDFSKIFLPYGPILFSLWGASMIPEIEEMLGKNKKALKRVIITSLVFTAIVYLAFIFLVLGISGSKTSSDAISGLKDFVSNKVLGLGLALGLMTTFTSFIALSLTIKKVFAYDLKIKPVAAFVLSCSVPLILFLLGFQDFLKVISFVGGIMLGIEGILILLMYKKIKPGKMALVYPLILVFLGGILYEITSFLR